MSVTVARHVVLAPGRWTLVPGTGVAVWWEATAPTLVRRRGEFWDLSPLVANGQVRAWARLVARPELGCWPLAPLPRRVTYRSGHAERSRVGAGS